MKAAKYKNFEIADKAKFFFLQYNYPAQPIFAPKTLQSYLSSFGFVMYVCPGV